MLFMAGGGVMTVLSAVGGAWTEAAALGLVGAGMLVTSQVLGVTKAKDAAAPLAKSEIRT